MTSRRAVQEAWQPILPALLVTFLVLVADPTSSKPAQSDSGLSDYQYYYEELPEGYQSIAVRDVSHIQHVPANAPLAAQTAGASGTGSSAIQRVPRASGDSPSPSPVPLSGQTTSAPLLVAPAAEVTQSVLQAPTISSPQAELSGSGKITQNPKATPLDALSTSNKKESDDMETANFFWGLGPVYPHLYVYRRIPHLVPLPGWNPYHAYYLSHPM